MARDYRRLFRNAVEAGKNREYEEAIKQFTFILSSTDDFPAALLYLGRSYHAIGEYNKAIGAFRIFLKRYKNSFQGNLFLGRSYLAQGLQELAVKPLKIALSIRPADSSALGLVGLCLMQLKRPLSAIQYLEKAVLADPDNKRIYRAYLNAMVIGSAKLIRRGEVNLGSQMLSFAISEGCTHDMVRLYYAKALREMGQFDAAIQQYDLVIANNPDDSVILWQRSIILLEMGRTKEAIQEIAKLKSANPDLPDTEWSPSLLHRALAWNLFKSESYSQAAECCRGFIKQYGHDPAIHGIMGESFRILGSLDKAKNHYMFAIKQDAANLGYRYGLIMTLMQNEEYSEMLVELKKLRSHETEYSLIDYYETLCASKLSEPSKELVARIQKSMHSRPADPYLMFALGECYQKIGFPELSIAWLKKVLQLIPEDEKSSFLLIECYQEIGDVKETLNAFEYYLSIFIDSGRIRKQFINLLIQDGQYSRAAIELESQLSMDRGNKERDATRRVLALCYRNEKRYREAAVLYRELLRDNPKSIELLKALVYCLEKDKQYEIAIRLLEGAKSFFPKDIDTALMLGIIYYRNKKLEKSLDIFRKVTDDYPSDYRAYRNISLIYANQHLTEISHQFLEKSQQLEKASKARQKRK